MKGSPVISFSTVHYYSQRPSSFISLDRLLQDRFRLELFSRKKGSSGIRSIALSKVHVHVQVHATFLRLSVTMSMSMPRFTDFSWPCPCPRHVSRIFRGHVHVHDTFHGFFHGHVHVHVTFFQKLRVHATSMTVAWTWTPVSIYFVTMTT